MANWQAVGLVLLIFSLVPSPGESGRFDGPFPSSANRSGRRRLVPLDERHCVAVESYTKYVPVPKPFLCHPTFPALPLPSQPIQQMAVLMLGLKMAGWQLCERPVLVPLKRLQRTATCCPGWRPSVDGGCNRRAEMPSYQCQNGGYMVPRRGQAVCSCPPGFGGTYCQVQLPAMFFPGRSRQMMSAFNRRPVPPLWTSRRQQSIIKFSSNDDLDGPIVSGGDGRMGRHRPLPSTGSRSSGFSPVPSMMLSKLPPLPPFPLGPITPVVGPNGPSPFERMMPSVRVQDSFPRISVLPRKPSFTMQLRSPPRLPSRPQVSNQLPVMSADSGVFARNQIGFSSLAACHRSIQNRAVRCLQKVGINPRDDGTFNPFSQETLRKICSKGTELSPCMMSTDQICGNGFQVLVARRVLTSFMSSLSRMCAVSAAMDAEGKPKLVPAPTGPLPPVSQLTPLAPDDPSPLALCENGGTEVMQNGEMVCSCPPGFEGINCEIPSLQPAIEQNPTVVQPAPNSGEVIHPALPSQSGLAAISHGEAHPDLLPSPDSPGANADPIGIQDNPEGSSSEDYIIQPVQDNAGKDSHSDVGVVGPSLPASSETASVRGDDFPPETVPLKVQGATLAGLPLWMVLTVSGGFLLALVVLSLICCLCYRYKSKQKTIIIEKEAEKKPIPDDSFYPMGVPPPVYEVNGKPPLSYEENKEERTSNSEKEEGKAESEKL